MYKVVDLFAGAGGLSLGFTQTQKFDIKVAFENNPHMQNTYRFNHPSTEVMGDVCKANYADIQKKYGSIDVVIGGPPCQGFSNANRQKNHAINKNNMLIKQYIRAIVELQPKAFVMENVSMLQSKVHRFYLEKKDMDLIEEYRIPIKETNLYLLEKDLMFEGVLEIVQNRDSIKRYLWKESHYAELNIVYKVAKNTNKLKETLDKHKPKLLKIAKDYINTSSKDNISCSNKRAFTAVTEYYSGIVKAEDLHNLIEPAIKLQRMLSIANEIFENDIVVDKYDISNGLVAVIRSFAVYDYLTAILGSEKNGYVINCNVLCAANYGAPQKRMRFVVIGTKKTVSDKIDLPVESIDEGHYLTVRDAIEDLENIRPITKLDKDIGIKLRKKNKISKLGKSLRDAKILKNHIVTQTTDTAMKRFRALKQGQNFHALDESLKTNTYTDTSRTQNTIYLRLKYDEPCGTVVNVRKSMWIHPTKDRAISIREAARLQTFPDSFVFCGTKDQQYQQVGNAVPPIMAKAIAENISKVLDSSL